MDVNWNIWWDSWGSCWISTALSYALSHLPHTYIVLVNGRRCQWRGPQEGPGRHHSAGSSGRSWRRRRRRRWGGRSLFCPWGLPCCSRRGQGYNNGDNKPGRFPYILPCMKHKGSMMHLGPRLARPWSPHAWLRQASGAVEPRQTAAWEVVCMRWTGGATEQHDH